MFRINVCNSLPPVVTLLITANVNVITCLWLVTTGGQVLF